MRKFVHLSMLLLVVSLALSAICPVLAQEPVEAEEAETEAVSEESEESEAEAEAETEGEHAVSAEHATEAHSPDSSDHAPGAKLNTKVTLVLTGMIVLFAVGAVAIRRL